jgi:RimJ/RimL family protein N-acetyltransferase
MEGPANDEWWMATIADPVTDAPLGDLALHLSWANRTAEIGYTLAREHWSKGYAVEAAAALVTYLFDTIGVTRVFGMLHPANPASAMVLERLGMRFEGHTRASFWVGDDNSDDWIYGMTRQDWEEWRSRRRTPPAEVRLVEVTSENFAAVYRLATHKTQESFVAPVPRSLAQALIRPSDSTTGPWFRAIDADGEITGFVMVAMPHDVATDAYLWRLLIDRMHQRRGIASLALDLVDDEVRRRGYPGIRVSWVDGKGSPAPFYEARGFVRTGEIHDGEAEARKAYSPVSPPAGGRGALGGVDGAKRCRWGVGQAGVFLPNLLTPEPIESPSTPRNAPMAIPMSPHSMETMSDVSVWMRLIGSMMASRNTSAPIRRTTPPPTLLR